jgi:hypothetical protein
LGRGKVLSAEAAAASVFWTESWADFFNGCFDGALPVWATAVAAVRTTHVKICFQSIGTLKLNFIKLESLCPFAKAVQQKLWPGLGLAFQHDCGRN